MVAINKNKYTVKQVTKDQMPTLQQWA